MNQALSFIIIKSRARHVLSALLLALLVAPNVSQAEKPDWKTVSADKLEIIFRGEELGMKFDTAKTAWTGSLPGFVEFIQWRSVDRFAIVIGWKADPGYTWYYQNSLDDKDSIKSTFGYTANKTIQWGASELFYGQLGRVDIHFLKAGGADCISWGFGYDDSSAGRPYSSSANNVVRGLYCQKETIGSEFAKRVVLLSGHKGGYEPPRAEKKIAAKPADPTRDTASRAVERWKSVPLATSWGALGEQFIGHLKYRNNAAKGTMKAAKGTISCWGKWQSKSGQYGTAILPNGIWKIACSDGRAASGTYISKKLGQGIGFGRDSHREVVQITYGAN